MPFAVSLPLSFLKFLTIQINSQIFIDLFYFLLLFQKFSIKLNICIVLACVRLLVISVLFSSGMFT